TRALVLVSILPLALALTPAAAHGQRIVSRDCWIRCSSRFYDRSYDVEVARVARQAAARARADSRAAASRVRAEARAYASAARADTKAWERRARTIPLARFRADELRSKLRDRLDSRVYVRRGPNYRRW